MKTFSVPPSHPMLEETMRALDNIDAARRHSLLDGLARMVEAHRDAMVRSNPTMTVEEHRRILTAIAADIRAGLVAL